MRFIKKEIYIHRMFVVQKKRERIKFSDYPDRFKFANKQSDLMWTKLG